MEEEKGALENRKEGGAPEHTGGEGRGCPAVKRADQLLPQTPEPTICPHLLPHEIQEGSFSTEKGLTLHSIVQNAENQKQPSQPQGREGFRNMWHSSD